MIYGYILLVPMNSTCQARGITKLIRSDYCHTECSALLVPAIYNRYHEVIGVLIKTEKTHCWQIHYAQLTSERSEKSACCE